MKTLVLTKKADDLWHGVGGRVVVKRLSNWMTAPSYSVWIDGESAGGDIPTLRDVRAMVADFFPELLGGASS